MSAITNLLLQKAAETLYREWRRWADRHPHGVDYDTSQEDKAEMRAVFKKLRAVTDDLEKRQGGSR